MKTSLSHLPEHKQEELREIVACITERIVAEMVILFGSYARGDWVEDKYVKDGTTYEYQSDYDLLVVIDQEEKARRSKFTKKLKRTARRDLDIDTPSTVIYHGIDYLNEEIEDGNYFFNDILREGIRLYDSERYALSEPKMLTAADRLRKAKKYFEQWYKSATMFFISFKTNFDRGEEDKDWYPIAAFELHQATERYYVTTSLVFTDYKPKTHDLSKLDTRICKLDNRFKTVFPRQTEQEKAMFSTRKPIIHIDSRDAHAWRLHVRASYMQNVAELGDAKHERLY